MNLGHTIEWLLEGDPSIQYQAWRDLLELDKSDLQNGIATEGRGLRFLSKRHPDGNRGDNFYQTKWISTHYTLLVLRNLNLPASTKAVQDTIELVLRSHPQLAAFHNLGSRWIHQVYDGGMTFSGRWIIFNLLG